MKNIMDEMDYCEGYYQLAASIVINAIEEYRSMAPKIDKKRTRLYYAKKELERAVARRDEYKKELLQNGGYPDRMNDKKWLNFLKVVQHHTGCVSRLSVFVNNYEDCKRFFKSGWFETLSWANNINPDVIREELGLLEFVKGY